MHSIHPLRQPQKTDRYRPLVCLVAIPGLIVLTMLAWSFRNDKALMLPSTATMFKKFVYYRGQPLNDNIPENVCSIEGFNQGQWEHEPIKAKDQKSFEKETGYHCHKKFPHQCYKRNKHELDRNRHIVDYTWKPSECSVLSMDPHTLAQHLSEHPLLFIGDSITQLQFESLSCLLGEYLQVPKKNEKALTGGNPHIKVNQLVYKNEQGDKALAVAFLRSDNLVRLGDYKVLEPMDDQGELLSKGSNYPWRHLIPYFDYIVLNTGPHWRSDLKFGPNRSQEELLEGYTAAMNSVFQALKEDVESHQRVWLRTSPFGHTECSQYSDPQETIVKPSPEPYEWNMFEPYNEVYSNWIAKQQGDERFQLLDVSFTDYRGDAHSRPDKDCLHFCLPGPVDDWNRLLYHEIAKLTFQSYNETMSNL
ncbi:GDSL/SGNH-like acyl-esterase family found in Pmr5 and Cas1p-domain-containing protein [Phascolomyces articulosus]|uniref:GDSL/SGNH-like acyl-esterase family found in Pmr5 and Cas1p-domain-containing protein n=1 Tax=Phascolomyces articulosus TaxID=60185 RepID=A0AAD5PLR7_9FUNG|nr:GDSL/SGNH-like acyl-esterase family found in Pmr5 and Cas1p-domain-containing protein [Phascolomyces articulosus]